MRESQIKLFSIFLLLAAGVIRPMKVLAQPESPGVSVWAAGSTEKIQDKNRAHLPHDDVWDYKTRTVILSGVRGEYVPFQLVISTTGEPVSDVTLNISELRDGTNVLSVANMSPYLEYLVMV